MIGWPEGWILLFGTIRQTVKVPAFLACLLLGALVPAPVLAQATEGEGTPAVQMEAKKRGGYVRIVLRLPNPLQTTMVTVPGQVQVTLPKGMELDYSGAEGFLAREQVQLTAETADEAVTFWLALPEEDWRVRRFIGQRSLGIDLLPPAASPVRAPASPGGLQAPLDAQAPDAAAVPGSPTTSLLPPSVTGQGQAGGLASWLGRTLAGVVRPKPVSPYAPAQGADAASPSASDGATGSDVQAQQAAAGAVVSEETQGQAVPARRVEKVPVTRTPLERGVRIQFAWQRPVASAIFTRGPYIWVVFNEAEQLNLDVFREVGYLEEFKQLKHRHYTIVRLKLSERFENKLYRANQPYLQEDQDNVVYTHAMQQGFAWVLELTEDKDHVPEYVQQIKPLSVETGAGPGGSGTAFIGARKAADPLEIRDKTIGDTIVIVPLYLPGAVMRPPRQFVEFALPYTFQGIVIERKADHLRYKVLSDGVRISGMRPLHLSPGLFTRRAHHRLDQDDAPVRSRKEVLLFESVFPFVPKGVEASDVSEAEAKDGEAQATADSAGAKEEALDFITMRRALYQAIRDAEADVKTERRLDLARFFFSQALYAESLGAAMEIRAQDPAFDKMQEVDLIVAASQMMLGHHADAHRLLSTLAEEAVGSSSHDELLMWQWMARARMLGGVPPNEPLPVDYIDVYDKFLRQYPAAIAFDFGLFAIEDHLTRDEVAIARTVMDIISDIEVGAIRQNSLTFLRALASHKEGNDARAMKLWEQLTEEVEDRYNRARARLWKTREDLARGVIDIETAAEHFDAIGVIWREDNLEMNLLKLVGQLYIDNTKYMEGLRRWQTLIANFPNQKEALFVAGEMKRVFIELFEEGKAYELQPFQALALYFEFRELTPVGPRGDQMVQQLAEHFIKADLLDNAASLLTHQLRFRIKGEARHPIALKLGDLYLQNRQPEMVERALNFIDTRIASEETKAQMRYLKGRGHLAMGDYGAVLEVLQDDFSPPAQDLRLDMFWDQQNWFGLIRIIEERMPQMWENHPFPLLDHQTKDILRLGVAYGIQEHREKLRALRRDFGPRLSNEKAEKIFDFVSHDVRSVNHQRFTETVQLEEIQSFINDYAFWPAQAWKNVAGALEERVARLKEEENLTPEQRYDVVRLALAYAMQTEDEDAFRALRLLQRDFRQVMVDRDTIGAFTVLDDPIERKQDDAVFEGKIPLIEIPEFVPIYNAAPSISELNIAIR